MKYGDTAPPTDSGGIACVSCENEVDKNSTESLNVRWINHGKGENRMAAWRR